MPAVGQRGVVFGRQLPADLLGQPRRDRDGDRAAGLEHSGQLGERSAIVAQVLHDLGRDDPIERAVGEGKPQRITANRERLGGFADLAGLAHRPEEVADAREFVEAVVERDHSGASAQRLERVATGATPHVENQVAGLQIEPVVVDGQHRVFLSFRRVRRVAPGSAPPCEGRCCARSTGR